MNKKRKAAFHVFGTLVLLAAFLWLLRSHGLEHDRKESLQKPPDAQLALNVDEASSFEMEVNREKSKVPSPLKGHHSLSFTSIPDSSGVWFYMEEIALPPKGSQRTKYSINHSPIGVVVQEQDGSYQILGFTFAAKPSEAELYLEKPLPIRLHQAYEVKLAGSSALDGQKMYIQMTEADSRKKMAIRVSENDAPPFKIG